MFTRQSTTGPDSAVAGPSHQDQRNQLANQPAGARELANISITAIGKITHISRMINFCLEIVPEKNGLPGAEVIVFDLVLRYLISPFLEEILANISPTKVYLIQFTMVRT